MRRFAPSLRLLACLPVLALAACDDEPTEPAALLIAAETEAALQVAGELPTLPKLAGIALDGADRPAPAGTAAPAAALAQARGLWLDAEAAGDEEEAATLREAAYRLAAPALAASLDSAGWAEAHEALRRWLEAAGRLTAVEDLGGIAVPLADGRAFLNRSRVALAAGDPAGAADALLRSADRLLLTTPRAVALRLTRDAEAALARRRAEGRPDPAEAKMWKRAERLTRGAREAVAAGDYALAIRRAFYAGQILRSE